MEEKAVACTRGAKAIRQALIDLMAEKEYDDITAGEIIQRSTYSRSCFYQHYFDKLDVAQQIVQEESVCYVQTLIAQMQRHAAIRSEEDYKYAIALDTLRYIQKKRGLYRLIFRGKFPGMDLDFFCDLAVENFNRLSPFRINPGYTREELEFFNYSYTHMVARYIRFWELRDFEPEPDRLAAWIAALHRMAKPGQVFTPSDI